MKKSVLVLMSGGIDSAVLAKHYLDKGWEVKGVFVDHGQPMLEVERKVIVELAKVLGVGIVETLGGEFDYDGYFGPVRNLYLLTLAVNLSYFYPFKNVAIGVCNGEYLDTRPEFIDRFNFMLEMCLKDPIYVLAPFAHWSKSRVIKYGIKIGAPLYLTYSCMEYPPCGKCGDCKIRAKFHLDGEIGIDLTSKGSLEQRIKDNPLDPTKE